MSVRILRGDCLDRLRELPDESVHCCVTSPPYYGLRDYGVAGQIGLEPTLGSYLAKMVEVFREVRRVLRSDGTLWLNIGDSYANDAKWVGSTGGKHVSALHDTNIGRGKKDTGLKPKDLMGVPWRLAFALQADGWWLRSEIIWHKRSTMPESVTDRPTKSHEQIFLLAKSERYFYDSVAASEPVTDSTIARCSQEAWDEQEGSDRVPGKTNGPMKAVVKRSERRPTFRGGAYINNSTFDNSEGGKSTDTGNVYVENATRNWRDVWSLGPEPFKDAHFATFPTEIPRRAIVAGCPGRVCAKCGEPITGVGINAEHGMRDVREGVQFSEVRHGANEVLQSDMLQRGEAKEGADSDMCDVRQDIQAGPAKPHGAVLQQGMCVSAHGKNTVHDEGVLQDQQGLHPGVSAGAPERIDAGLCDGASSCDGERTGAAPAAERSGASQERGEGRQPAVELGTANKNGTRQAAETSDQANSLPALQRTDRVVWSCQKCQADLSAPGAIGAGVVLDCFLGSGTTALVADRLQRDCIGIELNPQYADMAERRIKGDSPLFAEVAA